MNAPKLLLLLFIFFASVGTHAKSKENTIKVSKKEILKTSRLVNDWFMKKWPDPSKDVEVKGRTRKSNLWTRGVYYEGLLSLYSIDKDERYFDYAEEWCKSHNWAPRNGTHTRSADDYCCCQTYIDMKRLGCEDASLDSVKALLDGIIIRGERSDGDWWWIDAIQMGMPVFMKYAKETGDKAYSEKAWNMYHHTRDIRDGGLRDSLSHLWWRDKDFNPPYTTPSGKKCFWSRGDGWVVAALCRVLDEMSPDDAHYDVYAGDLLTMLQALIPLQREDGFWNPSLADEEDYGGKEVTGTSLFLMGYAWALRHDLGSKENFEQAALKAWKAMKKAVHKDGMLGYQQGTGKQPKDAQPVTYDRLPDFDDFGVGCFLLGSTELLRYLSAE